MAGYNNKKKEPLRFNEQELSLKKYTFRYSRI